jgi:hypothetical protein
MFTTEITEMQKSGPEEWSACQSPRQAKQSNVSRTERVFEELGGLFGRVLSEH